MNLTTNIICRTNYYVRIENTKSVNFWNTEVFTRVRTTKMKNIQEEVKERHENQMLRTKYFELNIL